MKLTPALSLLLWVAQGTASLLDQAPLKQLEVETTDFDLIYELKKAEIIPTVLDAFKPLVTVNVTWANATAEFGNTINPALTQKTPQVIVSGQWLGDAANNNNKKSPQLVLALTDPDAPSRDDPEWSEICHWIVTDGPSSKSDSTFDLDAKEAREIMPYKPPGPPPKTGKHRYVFVALVPVNGTTERLDLVKPGDRQHWGYERERQGLRVWAESMGLGVVGANFIYEQNDEQ